MLPPFLWSVPATARDRLNAGSRQTRMRMSTSSRERVALLSAPPWRGWRFKQSRTKSPCSRNEVAPTLRALSVDRARFAGSSCRYGLLFFLAMLTLLHLSDIHFGVFDGNPNHDLEARVRDLMLEDIRTVHGQVGDMDAVLVVGDIARKGAEGEYLVARDFLDRTCELIGCDKNRVVCVPGNHDVDRQQHDEVHAAVRSWYRGMSPEETSDRLFRMLNDSRGAEVLIGPFSAYNEFALQYGCAIGGGALTWAPKSFRLGSRELLVFGITSAWICDSHDSSEDDAKRVVVGAFQCGQVAVESPKVSIALMHHPLGWIRDAPQIAPWLNRAHILLTGHEHELGIQVDAAQRRISIASGAVNPERTHHGWVPAYNVIQLKADEGGDTIELTIRVRCWKGDEARFGPDERYDDPFRATIRPDAEDTEPEPHPIEAAPALPPEPIESQTHKRIFDVMRAPPDTRHRVARALGLVPEDSHGGLALDRAILEAASRAGKLEELWRGIEND